MKTRENRNEQSFVSDRLSFLLLSCQDIGVHSCGGEFEIAAPKEDINRILYYDNHTKQNVRRGN